jgi:hypothetical protein
MMANYTCHFDRRYRRDSTNPVTPDNYSWDILSKAEIAAVVVAEMVAVAAFAVDSAM